MYGDDAVIILGYFISVVWLPWLLAELLGLRIGPPCNMSRFDDDEAGLVCDLTTLEVYACIDRVRGGLAV